MMEPSWEAKKESPRRQSVNGSNNFKQIRPNETDSSSSPPVLQMPAKKHYYYEGYYEERPNLCMVSTHLDKLWLKVCYRIQIVRRCQEIVID